MEHPYHIIRRICQEKHVEPSELVGPLLLCLTESHGLCAVSGFAKGAGSKANIYNEIQGRMGLVGKGNEMPASMLDALAVMVQGTHQTDLMNLKGAEGAPRTPQLEALERKIKAEETLLLILRELINQSEAQSLNARMWIEDEAKKEGWILFDEDGADEEGDTDDEKKE